MIAAPAANLLIIRIFIENLPLHPGSSPDMAIYNDINAVGVNPPKGVFRQIWNDIKLLKKLANFSDGKFFLRNRENFLATLEEFVTI